jgi:hypothetical protein
LIRQSTSTTTRIRQGSNAGPAGAGRPEISKSWVAPGFRAGSVAEPSRLAPHAIWPSSLTANTATRRPSVLGADPRLRTLQEGGQERSAATEQLR